MIKIERATSQDAQGIKNVLAATWRDTYSSFLSEAAITKVSKEWHTPEALQAEFSRPSTFSGIAVQAPRKVVGMITAHSQGGLVVVARQYVLPDFQRQGIGQELMQASRDAFPEVSRLRLDVEEQNPKGRAFYARLGFTEVGRKTEEIEGTQFRSIVLEKDLKNAG